MDEIGNVLNTSNTQALYYQSSTAKKSNSSEVVDTSKLESLLADEDIVEILREDPSYKALVKKLTVAYQDEPPKTRFSVFSLVASLIELNQVLQGVATAIAAQLNTVTERMGAYAKYMNQIPVVLKGEITFNPDTKDDAERRAQANQKFGVMLEAIRTNKGLDEDKAKKLQTLLQTTKDASTQVGDFVTSFLDVFRGISQKINS